MVRASAAVSLLFAGSILSAWAYQHQQRENFYRQNGYYATQPSGGGSHYYHSHGIGWFFWGGGSNYNRSYAGGSYSGGGWSQASGHSFSSGITHGGFGAIGHAMGGHS